jgi:membrane-associated protease RseP (regulator of RpoE activity)
VPAIAEDQPTKVSPVPDLASNDVRALPSNEKIVAGADVKPPETPGKSRLPSPVKKVSPKTDRPGGGSIDLSQHEGVKLNARIPDPSSRSILQIPAKNVLTLIGVTATFNASGWNAVSVRVNSIAAHSGLRAGDVIEAINDQPVNEKTAFANRSILRSVRVRRDGKSIQVDLNR